VFGVRRDRLIFPTGTFIVTLCTPELKYAFEHDMVDEIGPGVLYESAPVFADYVTKYYQLRQDFKAADKPLYEHFIKLLLNSLYGKFGQKADIWEKVGIDDDHIPEIQHCIDADTGRRYKMRFLLGDIHVSKEQTEAFNSFPAIASHVTAFARQYMWHLMQVAGFANVFYCDTDSLFVNDRGFNGLADYIDSTTLGMLKIEYETRSIDIRGPKDYSTDVCNKIKGISRQAVQIGDNCFAQQQWPSLRGMLGRGETEHYTVKNITKTLNRHYVKGMVQSDGSVQPLCLADVASLEIADV